MSTDNSRKPRQSIATSPTRPYKVATTAVSTAVTAIVAMLSTAKSMVASLVTTLAIPLCAVTLYTASSGAVAQIVAVTNPNISIANLTGSYREGRTDDVVFRIGIRSLAGIERANGTGANIIIRVTIDNNQFTRARYVTSGGVNTLLDGRGGRESVTIIIPEFQQSFDIRLTPRRADIVSEEDVLQRATISLVQGANSVTIRESTSYVEFFQYELTPKVESCPNPTAE